MLPSHTIVRHDQVVVRAVETFGQAVNPKPSESASLSQRLGVLVTYTDG